MTSPVRSDPATRTVTVADLLEHTEPAYGGTWEQALAGMLADPFEAHTIARLQADLAAGRSFTTPVVLDEGRVGNGMHRIAASVLHGRATILVRDGWPDVGDADYPIVEVRFTLQVPDALRQRATGTGEDLVDDLSVAYSLSRSFPVGEHWVEGGLSATDDVFSALFNEPHSLAEPVVACLRERARHFGVVLGLVDVVLDTAAVRYADLAPDANLALDVDREGGPGDS